MSTYKIVRKYCDMEHPDHNKLIESGLTLEEAQEHCSDGDTHEKGVWMDVFYEETLHRRRPSFMEKLCMLQTPDPGKHIRKL